MPSLTDTRCSESVEPVGDIASHSFVICGIKRCIWLVLSICPLDKVDMFRGKFAKKKTKKIRMIFNEFKFRIHIVHICKNYLLAFSVTNHLVWSFSLLVVTDTWRNNERLLLPYRVGMIEWIQNTKPLKELLRGTMTKAEFDHYNGK